MLTLGRRISAIGLVVISAVACVRIGGLEDKADAQVIAGQLTVHSCWPSDRLISVRVIRPDGSVWTATEQDAAGLALTQPVTVDQVAASGRYNISGVQPITFSEGDHIYFETTQEARNFVLTESMLTAQSRTDC